MLADHGLNDAVQSMIVTRVPLSELQGVVMYADAGYSGPARYFRVGTHPFLGALAGRVSSVYIPAPGTSVSYKSLHRDKLQLCAILTSGYIVLAYSEPGLRGQQWQISNNATDLAKVP